ncbi:MAG: peptidoglycan DD-metalloendopeptidase family protein [Candidatus Uhrbacteria bacterium]
MKSKLVILALVAALILPLGSFKLFAAEDVSDDINELNDDIEEKQTRIDEIDRRMDLYQSEIDAAQDQEITLSNETALLENKIALTELDIESTQLQMDEVELEISVLEHKINELEAQLIRQREVLASILRRINEFDDDSILELVFSTDNFSELFDQVRYLEEVNSDLDDALEQAQATRDSLQLEQLGREERLERLAVLQEDLAAEQLRLEHEMGAKQVLIAEAQYSEAQFSTLLYELRQEQQYVDQQVALLQREIESLLYEHDEIGDATVLTWPLDPSYRGISAYFHDPSYPFRHLFEHPGVDIPAPQGSQIVAPAPGYVAWVKQGRSYGNYVMIIHANGLATLYAHLSQPLVEADQFVTRGEVIGLSGGMPGTSGAGLSTGPHLHFEVRLNGVPVNPMNYLIDTYIPDYPG